MLKAKNYIELGGAARNIWGLIPCFLCILGETSHTSFFLGGLGWGWALSKML